MLLLGIAAGTECWLAVFFSLFIFVFHMLLLFLLIGLSLVREILSQGLLTQKYTMRYLEYISEFNPISNLTPYNP